MLIRLSLVLLTLLPASAMAQRTNSYAPIVKQVAPAVVNIYTKRKVTVRQGFSPLFNDPFFNRMFQHHGFGGRLRERVESSLGSGVIVDADAGLVITNAHVVEGADEITVVLADGQEYEATLSLADAPSDLALLQIADAEGLPEVTLKPAETLEVGDIVLAIGNPFGVGQTVTSGIVSAQGRSALDISDFNFFIQTDAAINPGNSGGALVAMDGGVVGINTAIFSRDGGSLGIGFAIPSEMVQSVLAAAKSGQSGENGIVRPWLGVTAQTLTAEIAESLGLEVPRGVLIAALHPASPLSDAGIRVGDVITGMNGNALRDPAEMKFRMATVPLGDKAALTILRGDKSRDYKVLAMAPPEDPPREETVLEGAHPLSGAVVANINPAVAVELGLDDDAVGVVVMALEPGSAARRLVREGSVLVDIMGREIEEVRDVTRALRRYKPREAFEMVIETDGQRRRVVLR